MKQIMKQVTRIGNGAHIVLPKETIGKNVIVTIKEKTVSEIKDESVDLLKPYLDHIMGIYLHGSYARHEQTADSDIDLLVITDGKVKIPKRSGDYEIMSMSLKELQKSLNIAAPLILPSIMEVVPIVNKSLMEPYKKIGLTKESLRWYIESTQSALDLAKKSLEMDNYLPAPTYSLILRLRGLILVECLLQKKRFSARLVSEYLRDRNVRKINELYDLYRQVRDDRTPKMGSLTKDDIWELHVIVHALYQKVRLEWEKLK